MKRTLLRALSVLVIVVAVGLALYILFADIDGLDFQWAEPVQPGGGVVRVATWNLYNFGASKDDEEIAFIAEQLRSYDLVAVQEVSTGPAGAQAVARLADELDRKGFNWDYAVSDPTSGDGSERYAFLWKTSRVRMAGAPWLEASVARAIDREPFCARFEARENGAQLLFASLHAVPTSKNPAHEIAYLTRLHERYEADHVIIAGDFNLSQEDKAFRALKRLGYASAIKNQPTSLRRKKQRGANGHLANEYDNIFYETQPLYVARAGVADFTSAFRTLSQARDISDHLPVYMEVGWTDIAPPATATR